MPSPPRGLKLRQLAERDQPVFASYPQVARYFPAAASEEARARLSRTIDRGDGPGLVIGAPGTGKSLLLQVLAAKYHERFDVVLLACARLCTRRALLQAILFELGLPYKMRDEGELRLSLLDHLLSNDCPAGLLLLVDEAQALPIPLLDELRVLTNLVRGGVPRVRLVLAGSSALEEAFAHPDLESFSQRLAARCYLAPLKREETMEYTRAQIAVCGGAPDDIFAPDAWQAIFEATDGVPRLVNQLCDRALFCAATKHCSQIDEQVVQEAWSDLQQLPTPWEPPSNSVEASGTSDVIEFGGLSVDSTSYVCVSDDALLESDATELDGDDEAVVVAANVMSFPNEPSKIATVAADPFAEKFDEEEVVLDNFAAWDDMFQRDVQRVANRRDPGFSTLVQSAIEASPVSASKFAVAPSGGDEDVPEESPSDWPRLRLVDVADASRIDLSDYALETTVAEDPLLVIEDDAPQNLVTPPVRREDYRQLFSRLRSG